jgi:hypothetical protein
MQRDAEKDPAINPNSVHAKLLVNQVSAFSCLLMVLNMHGIIQLTLFESLILRMISYFNNIHRHN